LKLAPWEGNRSDFVLFVERGPSVSSAVEAFVQLSGLGLSAVAPSRRPLGERSLGHPGRAAFVALSPADPVLMVGGVVALQARLVFSDLNVVDVTEAASWTSSAPEVATPTARGPCGRFVARAPGTARLFASAGGKVGWTTVTVLVSG
jgi:hypothetical protein